MKIVSVLTGFLLGTSTSLAAESNHGLFQPHSISYEQLLDESLLTSGSARSSFLEALSATGMLTVSDIPNFRELRQQAVFDANACSKVSNAAKTTSFADGTKRTTLASVNLAAGKGLQEFTHGVNSRACTSFDSSSMSFRNIVSEVTSLFSKRLSAVFNVENGKYFLNSESGKQYDSILSIVEDGDHLEHFHSYKKSQTLADTEKTIEFHTDQGLFIAFTPSIMTKEGVSSGNFLVQHANGIEVEVDFSKSGDHLVFMMGDGVNQYINNYVSNGNLIHATPHAIKLASGPEERLWYGRMVLPPKDAIMEQHDLTYGRLRQLMVENLLADPSKETVSLGCSGNSVARELSDDNCPEDNLFCWSRCMNASAIGLYYEGFPYSNETCQERGFDKVACIDPSKDQIAPGSKHGGFRPSCTNSTEVYVNSPKLNLTDPDTCDAFESFVKSKEYDNSKSYGDQGEFVVQWNANLTTGEVCWRVAFNGNPGWLSIGFSNPEGSRVYFQPNTGVVFLEPLKMMGTDIVMGIFNEYEGQEVGVNEYRVHDSEASWSNWRDTKSEANLRDNLLWSDECYAEMEFCSSRIGATEFGLSEDEETNFMWGYTGNHVRATVEVGKHRGNQRDTGSLILNPRKESGASKETLPSFAVALTTAFIMAYLK